MHTPLKQALLALWALFTDLRIMGKRFAAFRGVFYSEASRTDLEPVHSLLRAPYFTIVELNVVPSVDARSYGRGGGDIFMSTPVIEIWLVCLLLLILLLLLLLLQHICIHGCIERDTPPAGHFRQEGSFSAPPGACANGLRE